MKKTILLLSIFFLGILPWPYMAQAQPIYSNITTSGELSCGPTSEPAGDIASDGFEGSGSGGYDAGYSCGPAPCGCGAGNYPCWATVSGTQDPAYALSGLSGGTGDTKNCNYGLRINTTSATNMVAMDTGTNSATTYVEFSLYIDSETWGTYTHAGIYYPASTYNCSSGYLYIVRLNRPGSSSLYFFVNGATNTPNSSVISLDTWYYFKIYGVSASSTCHADIGTTYGGSDVLNSDFTCQTVATNPRYFCHGITSAKTIDMTFGYTSVDSDGSY